jgi:hypothetical protein
MNWVTRNDSTEMDSGSRAGGLTLSATEPGPGRAPFGPGPREPEHGNGLSRREPRTVTRSLRLSLRLNPAAARNDAQSGLQPGPSHSC